MTDYNERYRSLVNLSLAAFGPLVPIVGLVGLHLLWHSRGRDVPVGVVADYLAEPPSDLPPGLVGTLVDDKVDMKDIIAALVDLARRAEAAELIAPGLFPQPQFDVRRTR